MSGFSTFDAMRAQIASLGTLAEDVVKEAAKPFAQAIEKTAAEGKTPDGEKWQPKKDGGAPLVHAAEKITISATGKVLAAKVPFPESLHNRGTKTRAKRQILPDAGDGLPPQIANVLQTSAERVFARKTGGNP